MTEGSPGMNVKNRAAMFNQQHIIRTTPPPIAKKPPGGQSNGTINHVIKPDSGNTSNGVHSTAAAKKRFTPPPGAFAGIPTVTSDINEIRNRLKRAPPPKAPVSEAPKDSPFPRRPSLNKPAPKPKPKPAVSPRKPVVGSGPISPTLEHAKDNIPKSDVDSTSLSSFTSDSSLPRTESSTSRTESSASRRTSGKPELQVLPPAEILGGPPPKPRKPPTSIVLPSPTAALKPANKRSSFLYKQRGSPVVPPLSPPAAQEEGEQEEFYDDVDHPASSPALPQARQPRPPSLIPTMDSDEEEGEGESADFDDFYDDTAVPQLTNLPPSLPDVGRIPPSLPDVSRIPPSLPDVGRIPPSLPPTDSIPHLPPNHSPFPSGTEDSGGGDFGDIYDDVSNPDEEMEELYEALDTETVEELKANSDGISEASGAIDENNELSAKEKEAQKKKEEKLRKEQERQQKRDEERRKKEDEKKEKERQKKEREEKKRREKEEKDAKKKFNIKGEIQVIDVGAVIEDLHSEYADKLDLSASKGDRVEILRRDGNPGGKWLVRDSEGRYGYIPESCVTVEGDSQEVYDDVAAVEGEMEDIYDSVDDH